MKIAIYSGAVPSTTFIERLILGLADNGITVLLFGIQQKKQLPNKNIKYYTYTNKLSKLFQLIKYSILLNIFKPKAKKALDAIIINKKNNARLLKVKYYPVLYHKPDIFHVQWAKSLDDWVWVQEFGIKLMLSLRGAHINYSPIANPELAAIYKHFFPKVDAFHAVSKAIAKEALKYKAKSSRVKVIYSGLPINELSYCAKENKGETLFVISVGRAHWKKGYMYALDGMALLKSNNINFQYTIIGVDEDEELRFQRSQLNLENEVHLLGHLPFEDVKNEIKKADVLLLSSVEEGIANVVLEAMALGTLVVSTDCGGMNEVIRNGDNGFLVSVRNPITMALALQKVASLSLKDYQYMTNTARKMIESKHNAAKMIREMRSLYGSVLNNRS